MIRCSGRSQTQICAGKRKYAISTSAPSAAWTRPPGPSGTCRQRPRSSWRAKSSSTQRREKPSGTERCGSSRPNNSRCTWQARSQQLRDCQAQGSPISGARNADRLTATGLELVVIVFGDARKAPVLQVLHHDRSAQRGAGHLHAGQLEFDRAIGWLRQIATEILAIEHLDVLPHAARGADPVSYAHLTLPTI